MREASVAATLPGAPAVSEADSMPLTHASLARLGSSSSMAIRQVVGSRTGTLHPAGSVASTLGISKRFGSLEVVEVEDSQSQSGQPARSHFDKPDRSTSTVAGSVAGSVGQEIVDKLLHGVWQLISNNLVTQNRII